MASTIVTTTDSPAEVKTALGRMFQMLMRPSQPGDVETYYAIRAIVMDATTPQPQAWTPNYSRDRTLGAAGDL